MISYDSDIELKYQNAQPYLLITLSDSTVDHSAFLIDYITKNNFDFIKNNKPKFSDEIRNLTNYLKRKSTYIDTSLYYHDVLLSRDTVNQTIQDDIAAINDLSHSKFISIYQTLIKALNR